MVWLGVDVWLEERGREMGNREQASGSQPDGQTRSDGTSWTGDGNPWKSAKAWDGNGSKVFYSHDRKHFRIECKPIFLAGKESAASAAAIYSREQRGGRVLGVVGVKWRDMSLSADCRGR